MKQLIALLLLLTNLSSAQSWGPMFDQQNTTLSNQGNMLNSLTTDAYVTLPGNLTGVLGLGNKQQVRNTANNNLHEFWVGTPDGNRLLTMRGGVYSTTLTTGQQVIAIPHGLPYTPSVYAAHIINQTAYTYTITVTGTYVILTLPNQITLGNIPFVVNWLAR